MIGKVNLNDKQIKRYLENHYKNYFNDENIKLSRNVYSDTYHDDVVTTIITRKVKIGNYSGEKKYVLTHDEIKNVLNEDLEKEGYFINYFRYVVYVHNLDKNGLCLRILSSFVIISNENLHKLFLKLVRNNLYLSNKS